MTERPGLPSPQESSPLHERGGLTREHWQEMVRLLPLKPSWPEDIDQDLVAFTNAQIRGLELIENSHLGNRHWLRLSTFDWTEENRVPKRFLPGTRRVIEESSLSREIREYSTFKASKVESLNDVFHQDPDERRRGYIIWLEGNYPYPTNISWGSYIDFSVPQKYSWTFQPAAWTKHSRRPYSYQTGPDPDTGLITYEQSVGPFFESVVETPEDIKILLDRYLLTSDDLAPYLNIDVAHTEPAILYDVATKLPENELIRRLKAQKPNKEVFGWEKAIQQTA